MIVYLPGLLFSKTEILLFLFELDFYVPTQSTGFHDFLEFHARICAKKYHP